MHERNCFVTLTYSDEYLPYDRSLDKRDWQLFMKRLRKRLGSVRFIACGEYGDKTRRPHWHACFFGINFDTDRSYLTTRNGYRVYTSEVLEDCWKNGLCEIGEFTPDSASYVAGYVVKKLDGLEAQRRYTVLDDFGEEMDLEPECGLMSRDPGIGLPFFYKYYRDLFSDDCAHIKGSKAPVPHFYRNWFADLYPEESEKLKKRRAERAEAQAYTAQTRTAAYETLLSRRKMYRKGGDGDVL